MNCFLLLSMIICVALTSHAQNADVKDRVKRDILSDCRLATVDLYVLVETSRLVGSTNIGFLQSYLKSIYSKLRVEPDRTRISLTSFGGEITNIATLNDLTNKSLADDAMDRLRVTGRGVKVQTALEYLADNLFTPEHGRNEDNEAICLVSVGSRIKDDISASVRKLQEKCRVIVIGSGYAVYRQIRQLASAPTTRHIIYSVRYKDLRRRVNHLLKSICTQPLGAPRVETFDIGPYSVSLRWGAQNFAAKYNAELRHLGSSKAIRVSRNIPARRTWVRFDRLEQASTYVAIVWAVGRDGEVGPQGTLVLNTGVQKPVIQINESSITSSSVQVYWEENKEIAASYVITARAVNNASNFVSNAVLETTTVVDGLSSGTNFSVVVSSLSSGLRSEDSDSLYFITVPSAPDLKVKQVKHISIDLKWPPVAGAATYVLTMYDLDKNVTSVYDDITSTSFKISDLTPSMKYQFRAYTIGTTGLVSSLSRLVTAYTAPSNPNDVTLDFVTERSIQIHWQPQPAAIRYNVIMTSPDNKRFKQQRNVTSTDVWFRGLKSGNLYKISVYSVGKGNIVDYNVVYPIHVQTVPSPPEGVRVLTSHPTGLQVTWNHTIGAKIYHVESEKLVKGEPTGDIYRAVNFTASTALVGGLDPGFEYRLTVRTESSQGGISKPSASIINSTVPEVPGKPWATWVNMTFMLLSMEPAEGAQSYVTEAEPLDGDEVHRQIIPFTDVSDVTVDQLLPGLWYSIKVRSINAFGLMNPQSSEVLHEQSVPAPPPIGSFWKVTSSSMMFRWPEVKGALSYNIYVTTTDVDDSFPDPTEAHYHTNDTEFQVWGLRSGTLYGFRAQSIGHSDRTSSLGRINFERTIPLPPTNIRHTRVTPSIITLEWEPAKGAVQYVIVMQSGTKRHETRLSSFRSRVQASELVSGTWHNFTIYSQDREGRLNENGSSTVNVQTVPFPPSNVRLRDASVTAYTVIWDEMWGAAAYLVRAETSDSDVTTRETFVRVNGSRRARVEGLDPGTRYRFYVRSIGFQEQRSRETRRVSDTTLPVTPEQPQLEAVTTTSMSLLWNDVKGATYFHVRVIQFTPGNSTEWEVKSDEPSDRVVDLLPGAWYNMSVYSVGTRNRRNWKDSEPLHAQTVPLAPITINISDITNTSIQLSWNNVTGAGYYVISVREVESGESLEDIETEEPELLRVGLETGTEYVFRVTSIGQDQDRKSSRSSPVKEETDPAAPDQPTFTSVTSQSVGLSWNSVKGGRSYIVQVTNLENKERNEFQVSGTEFVSGGLDSGTRHNFTIFSVGKLGRRSEYGSPQASVVTSPAVPQNIRTIASTTTSTELQWDQVKGGVAYRVNLNRGNIDVKSYTTDQARLLVENLTQGTEYRYDVIAIGEEGRQSERAVQHTDSTVPSTPDEPSVTSFDETSISVTWDAVEGNVINYVITFQEQGSDLTYVDESRGLEFKQSGLKAGVRYVISLHATGDGGKRSDQSPSVVQQTVTNAPKNFVHTSVGTDHVTLQWNDVTGASGYELAVKSENNDVDTRQVAVTSLTVSPLLPGNKYVFTLRSIGDFEVRSNEEISLEIWTVPSRPSGLTVLQVFRNRISFEWQPVKGAVRYKVQVTSSRERDVPTVGDVTSSRALVRPLRPGGWYNFTVYSIGMEERANLAGSKPLVVQTNPRFPGRFEVENFTINSIGASRYDVTISSSDEGEIFFNEDGGRIKRMSTVSTSLIVTSLRSGTAYNVTMQVVGQQEGRTSEKEIAFTQSTLPDTPSLPWATATTTSTIRLEWNDVRGATSYDVIMRSTELEEDVITSTVTNDIEVRNLRPGGVYDFYVYSVGNERNEVKSETLSVQTVTSSPDNFKITKVMTNSMLLMWDDVHGATSYEVRITPLNGQQPTGYTLFDVTSYLVTSLDPGTEYTFSVRSIGRDNVTESDVSRLVTMATLPKTVTDVTVDDVTETNVTLSWIPASGAQSYVVMVTSDLTNGSLEAVVSTATVSALRPGTWHEFRIESVGVRGTRNIDQDVRIRKQTVPNPPNSINVDEVTTTSIFLSWRKIHGASSYNVIVKSLLSDIISTYNVLSSETPKYKITDLSPGTKYVVTIVTIGEEGQISQNSREIHEGTRPNTTEGVDVREVSTRSVALTWKAVIGAEKYEVFYRANISSSERHVIESVTPEVDVIGLDPGTWYEFVVFSVGIKDRRNNKGSEKIQIQTVPSAPQNVTITNVTTSSITVTWNDVIGTAKYKVEYGTTEDDVTNIIETNVTYIKVTSLLGGTTYWFVVKSIGEESRISEGSAEVRDVTVPYRPTQPRVVNVTTNQIVYDWSDVKGATLYVIRVTSNNDGKLVTELQNVASGITVGNLTSGVLYDVTVYSVGVSDRLNRLGSDIVTQQTVPSFPKNFQITDVTTNSLMMSWEPVVGAASYMVTSATDDSDVVVANPILTTNLTSLLVMDLVAGTEYSFTVKAVGHSDLTSSETHENRETTLPVAPAVVNVTRVSTTTITLTWMDVKGAAGYVIKTRALRASGDVDDIKTAHSDVTVNKLQPGLFYNFTIHSLGTKDRINHQQYFIVTQQTTPQTPQNFSVTDVTTTSVTTSWDDVIGAKSYVVETVGPRATNPIITSRTSAVIDDLEPGITYGFTVKAVGHETTLTSNKSHEVEEQTTPLPPGRIRPGYVTTNSIQLLWDDVIGAEYFVVNVIGSDGVIVKTETSQSNRISIEDLVSGDTYRFTVASVGKFNRENIDPEVIVTQSTQPQPPRNIRINNVTSGSLLISWDESNGALYYVINMQTNGSKFIEELTSDRTFLSLFNLTSGIDYIFTVKAVGRQQLTSETSLEVRDSTLPTSPTEVRIINVESTSLSLAWSPVRGAVGYQITLSRPQGEIFYFNTDVNNATVSNLTPGDDYILQIVAIGTRGRHSDVTSAQVKQQTAPTYPDYFIVNDVTASSLRLTWVESNGAVAYYIKSYDEDDSVNVSRTNMTSLLLSNLPSGTTYNFTLTPIGRNELIGVTSPEIQETTLPSSPNKLVAVDVTTASVTLQWEDVKGSVGYIVEERERLFNVSDTRFEVSGLESGNWYRFLVYSFGVGGRINPNPSKEVRKQTVPSPPTGINVTQVNVTSVTIEWKHVIGAQNYQVQISTDDVSDAYVLTEANFITVLSLKPGTTYDFYVRTLGEEGQSSVKSHVVRETTTPLFPPTINVTSVSLQSAIFKWEEQKGAVSYVMFIESREGLYKSVDVKQTQVEILELSPGTWYDVTITSVGVNMKPNPSRSEIVSFQTDVVEPRNVSISQTTNSSFIVTWEEITGASEYEVIVTSQTAQSLPLIIQTTDIFAVVKDLEAGTTYDVILTTVSESDERSIPSDVISEATLPQTPTFANPVDVTENYVTLEWEERKGAESYRVEVVGKNDTSHRISSINRTIIDNLSPGSLYRFRIFSIDYKDRESESGSSFVTQQTKTEAPQNVSTLFVTTNSIFVSWNIVYGATKYKLSFSNSPDDLTSHILVNVTSYNLTSLDAGSEYYITVKSIGLYSGLESDESNRISVATLPEVVSSFVLTEVTTTSITVAWQPANGAKFYKLLFTSTQTNTSGNVKTSTTSATAAALRPGSWYKIRVISMGDLQVENSASEVSMETQTVPLATSKVEVSQINTRSLHITWNHVNGAKIYIVRYFPATDNTTIHSQTTNRTSSTLSSLVPGTTYVITVTSINFEDRYSAASVEIRETTRPAVTSGLTSDDVTTTSVSLLWQPVQGAEKYEVFYRANSSSSKRHVIESVTPEVDVIGLYPGTWYEFVVFSVGIKDRRNNKGSEKIQIQTVPSAPQNVTITNVTSSSITVTWNDVIGTAKYKVEYGTTEDDVTNIIETNVTYIKVTSLLGGTTYWFVVKSIGEESRISEESSEVRDVTVPELPYILTKLDISSSTSDIDWNDVKGAINYIVFIKLRGSNISSSIVVTESSAILQNLLPGNWYDVGVTSVGIENRKNPGRSKVLSFQTVPLPPSDVIVDEITNSSFRTTWSKAKGAANYSVTITSPNKNFTLFFNVTSQTTRMHVNELTSATQYNVSIASISEESKKSQSNPSTRVLTLADNPKRLLVVDVTNTSVKIKWGKVRGAESYRVEVVGKNDTSHRISSINRTIIDNLSPGSLYRFRIFSIDYKDRESESGSSFVTQQTKTEAPQNVSTLFVTTNSIFVSWNIVYGATKYKLSFSNSPDDLTSHILVNVTSYNLTSLDAGSEYYITVKSIGFYSGLESDESNRISVATLPEVVSSFVLTEVTTTSITVAWQPANGAKFYKLLFTSTQTNTSGNVKTSTTSATAAALRPGSWYKIRVISMGDLQVENSASEVSMETQTVPLATSKVEVSQINTRSLHITWNHVNGAKIYIVRYFPATDNTTIHSQTTNRTSSTLSSLVPGTTYVITVTSINFEDRYSAASVEIRETTRPAVTTGLTSNDVTTTSVSLLWQPVQGAEKYEVFYRANSSSSKRHVIESVTPEVDVIGLYPGTWYEFVVFSVGIKDRRNNKGSEKIQIQTVPSAPQNVTITNVTTSSITVTWNDVIGTAKYKVEYGTTEDDVTNIIETNVTYIKVTSLLGGTTYWFVVKSIGEESRISEGSAEVRDVTVPTSAGPPKVTDVTTNSITLSWNDVKGTQLYVIKVRNSLDEVIMEINGSRSYITIEGLHAGIVYNFSILTVGRSGRVNNIEDSFVTQQTVPNPPGNFRISDVTTTNATASWDDVIGAHSYLLVRQSQNVSQSLLITSQTSFEFDDLLPGILYTFSVKAVGDVTSSKSPTIQIQTVPLAPTSLTVAAVTPHSVDLQWNDVIGARNYVVNVTNSDSDEVIKTLIVEENKAEVHELEAGVFYEFLVFSVGEQTNRQNAFVTQQTVPGIPQNVRANDVTSLSIALMWDDVIGNTGYRVEVIRSENRTTIHTKNSSVVIDDLSPGITYRFTVKAFGHGYLTSESSQEVEEQTIPLPPTHLQVNNVSSTTIQVEWKYMKGAVYYRVDVTIHDSGDVIIKKEITANKTEIEGLSPGLFYKLVIYSIGENRRISETNASVIQQTVPQQPSGLTIDDVATNSLRLSFHDVQGAFGYVITFNSESRRTIRIVTSEVSNVVEGLIPGVTYRFTVKAVGHENLTSESSHEIVQQTIPLSPSNLRATLVTSQSIGLEWPSVVGARSYIVNITDEELNYVINSVESENNEAEISGLEAGTLYGFVVHSVGHKGRINERGSSLVTQQTAPNAPSNLIVNDVTMTSISFSWNMEKGADEYLVIFSEIEPKQKGNITTSNHMITIEDLKPGTEYTFMVKAVSHDGHMSDFSKRVTEMTLIGSPDHVIIADVTTDSINILWNAVQGASSYRLQVFPDIEGSSVTFPIDDEQYDVTGVVAGTRYRFRVRAVDRKGREGATWSQEVETVTVPLSPGDVTTSSVTSQSFVMTWNRMKGAVLYDVTVRSGITIVTSQKVKENRVSVVGLEPGSLYLCEIRSENVYGSSSDVTSLTQRTIPLPPDGAEVTHVEEDSMQLVWNFVTGAESYEVEIQQSGGRSFVISTNQTSALVQNVQSGTLYRIHVTAVTRENLRSRRVTSLTVRTRPQSPTNLQSERINRTSIRLSWDHVRGAVTYNIYVISTSSDKRKATTEFETKLTVTSNNAVISDLKPGVNYTFEVTANNLDGTESKRSQSLTQQTYALLPILPSTEQPLVTISNTSQTSLFASWPKIPNADSYVIILRTTRGVKEYTVRNSLQTSLQINLLFADTDYNVTMKALASTGETTEESFPPTRIQTKPFPPRTPVGVKATRIGANHVVIIWRKASRALSYDVTIVNSDTGVSRTRNLRENTVNITNLRHRENYVISVTSVGKFEKSRESKSITVVPRFPSPVMPRNVVRPLITIGSVTHDSFIVTLQAIPHAVSYEILVRNRRSIPKTIGNVAAFTPTLITELKQNTIYDVTFIAIGREGDRSRESDLVKTRTRRLVPGVPGDFQILHVTPNDVTVTWERALRAVSYRVRAQNTKSGRIVVFDNATPPYVIKGLTYRNHYQLSVISIGRFFDSKPSASVPVNIPYPRANNVSGISISQITSSGFLVTWTPTPFARSYMLFVAIGNSMVRRINGISTNEYRLKNLAAGTHYNVTVNAVSSDATTLTVGEWVSVKTAPFLPLARSIVTATGDPTTSILESIVTAFLETLQTIPDLPQEGDGRLNRVGFAAAEELEFRSKVLEHVQQITNALQSAVNQNSGGVTKKISVRRKRETEEAAFERIVSIAREIKRLKQSRKAGNDSVNSISERLATALSVVVTSQMHDVTVDRVQPMLFPLLRQRLRMILLEESPIVLHLGNSLTDERILSTFAPPSGITSTGFKVMWVGFQNVHRFKLVVTKLDEDSSTPVFEGLRSGRSVFISNLQPSTNYDVTIRPTTLRGDVIPGIVGKIIVTTLPAQESAINVTVTSLGSNHVTLAINRFPKGVGTLKFEIKQAGSNRVLQLKLIKAQHKVVSFTSLFPNTDYVITAKPVTSGTGISFETLIATKERALFVRPTTSSSQDPTDSFAPPTGLRIVTSSTNTVTLEWSRVAIAGTPSDFVRYNLRFYRAGTPILTKQLRLLRNNRAIVHRLTYPFYDVTVSTYNMRRRNESQESPLLRVTLT